MKTKRKIVLGFTGSALLIPVAVAICLYTTKVALERTIGEDSALVAWETLDKIEWSIGRRLEQVELYAEQLQSNPVLLASNRQFETLPDVRTHVDQIDREWTAAAGGPAALVDDLLHNELACELRREMEHEAFYQARYGYPVFGEVFVTNRYGANVAQTGITSDYDQADELWWQRAMSEGTYVGDVTFDESAGVHAVDLAIRITDAAERPIGVIRFVLNLEDTIAIVDQIRSAMPYRSTHLALLTANADVIYSTDAQCDPQYLTDGVNRHADSDTADRSWFFLCSGASKEQSAELLAHAHSRAQPGCISLGWTLLVRHDAAEIFAPVARLREAVLVPAAGISIVALILGLFVARSVARPLQSLAEAALQVSHGDLDVDLTIDANDEMGHLALCFGQMTRRLKTMLQQLHVEIEDRKTIERHLEVVNEQLTSTVVQLRGTNREMQDFTKAAAHDLKTPIRGIATLAEWLLADYRDRLDETGTKQLHLLLGRARRSLHLLDSMLDYARAGRAQDGTCVVDVETLVTGIARKIGIPSHIHLQIQAQRATVVTSERMLCKVLTCLLDNAVRCIDKPEGQITVASSAQENMVQFSVADNGPGIDAKYHEKVFGLFQRLESADESENAGAGLCIAKKIVESYGGHIWIESEPDNGATFHFTWPLQAEGRPTPEPSLASTAS